MDGRLHVGQIVWFVVSNRNIRQVKIIRIAGEFYTIRYMDSQGGTRIRRSRLFLSEEEAKNHISQVKADRGKGIV